MQSKRLSSLLSLALLSLSLSLSLSEATTVGVLPPWAKYLGFNIDAFAHCFVEDTSGDPVSNLILCWTVESGDQSITLAAGAVTKREGESDGRGKFVGVGITEGGMSGADIWTYSPTLGLQDRYSVTQSRPILDPADQQVARILVDIFVFPHASP